VPALIVSTAAGIIVSRAGSELSLGKEITLQVLFQYRAIAVASAILFGFALVPGLPGTPFMLLSVGAASLAFIVSRAGKKGLEKEKAEEMLKGKAVPAEKLVSLPPLDILALEVGYGIIHLVDMEQDGQLLDRIKSIRRQVAREIGIIVPPVHIQDNMQLKPGEYSILLKGNVVGTGELMINYCLAMDPGTAQGKLDGVPTKEPTYGLPAIWIKEIKKEDAIAKGYTVVDPVTVLTTHISDVIRRNSYELMGRQETQQMLDTLKITHPKVVEELIPNMLSLGGVVKVLQNLLKEQVPIRDLLAILETLADWAPRIKDIDMLTEYVRHSLSRTITSLHQTDKGDIPVITLGHSIEEAISGTIQRTEQGSFVAMEPDLVQKIVNALTGYMAKFSSLNYQPVILCSAQIRSHFKKLIDRFISNIAVISYDELVSNIEIDSLGIVELSDAD
jgi:flagellar biosynthesis protein FlhA